MPRAFTIRVNRVYCLIDRPSKETKSWACYTRHEGVGKGKLLCAAVRNCLRTRTGTTTTTTTGSCRCHNQTGLPAKATRDSIRANDPDRSWHLPDDPWQIHTGPTPVHTSGPLRFFTQPNRHGINKNETLPLDTRESLLHLPLGCFLSVVGPVEIVVPLKVMENWAESEKHFIHEDIQTPSLFSSSMKWYLILFLREIEFFSPSVWTSITLDKIVFWNISFGSTVNWKKFKVNSIRFI